MSFPDKKKKMSSEINPHQPPLNIIFLSTLPHHAAKTISSELCEIVSEAVKEHAKLHYRQIMSIQTWAARAASAG